MLVFVMCAGLYGNADGGGSWTKLHYVAHGNITGFRVAYSTGNWLRRFVRLKTVLRVEQTGVSDTEHNLVNAVYFSQ